MKTIYVLISAHSTREEIIKGLESLLIDLKDQSLGYAHFQNEHYYNDCVLVTEYDEFTDQKNVEQ